MTIKPIHFKELVGETQRQEVLDLGKLLNLGSGSMVEINQAIVHYGGVYGRIAQLNADAHAQLRQTRYLLQRTQDEIYLRIRADEREHRTKRASEIQIRVEVNAEEEVKRLIETELYHQRIAALMSAALESVREFGRMLQTLSANLRIDFDHEGRAG